ncbi:hypothetical protein [Pseudomonas sp. nanlin1]
MGNKTSITDAGHYAQEPHRPRPLLGSSGQLNHRAFAKGGQLP